MYRESNEEKTISHFLQTQAPHKLWGLQTYSNINIKYI